MSENRCAPTSNTYTYHFPCIVRLFAEVDVVVMTKVNNNQSCLPKSDNPGVDQHASHAETMHLRHSHRGVLGKQV